MFPNAQKLDDVSVVTRWVTEAKHSGETDVYHGKRQWPRTTWPVALVVKIVAGRRAGEVVYVRGKDVSLGGMGFFSRRKFAPHTKVELCAEGQPHSLRATIAHSTQTVGGYIVGVVFDTALVRDQRRPAG